MRYIRSYEFVTELAKLGIVFPENTRKATIVLDAVTPGLVEVELEMYAVDAGPAEKGIATRRYKLIADEQSATLAEISADAARGIDRAIKRNT